MPEIRLDYFAELYRDQLQVMEYPEKPIPGDPFKDRLVLPYSMFVHFLTEPRVKEDTAVNVWERYRCSYEPLRRAFEGKDPELTVTEPPKDINGPIIDLYCEFLNGKMRSEHSRNVFRQAAALIRKVKEESPGRITIKFDISRSPDSTWTLLHDILEIQPDYDAAFIVEFIRFIIDIFDIDPSVRAAGETSDMQEDRYSPIHIVCASKSRKPQYIDVVDMLGLDIEARTESGETAMSILARGEYYAFTVPSLELENRYLHKTNMDNVAKTVKLVRRLSRKYSNMILQEDSRGITPLALAAGHKDLKIFDAMLEAVSGRGHASAIAVSNIAKELVAEYSGKDVSHVYESMDAEFPEMVFYDIVSPFTDDTEESVGVYSDSKKLSRVSRYVNKFCSEHVVSG